MSSSGREASSDSSKKYKEQFARKKLHGFLNDLLRVGSVKGFRYFGMYLRGREELLLRVQNEQTCSGYHPLGRCESQGTENENASDSTDSFSSKKGLPRNSESFILSRDAQKTLSGFQFLAIGLPPASPCSSEISPIDHFTTLFLIASYARYKSPYVWVRTNHDRLIRLSDVDQSEQVVIKDSPLKLRSVLDWSSKDVKIWDIIGEIVRINVQPQPRNPFAVDHSYFDMLSLEECIIATGAMADFLQRILTKDHSYNSLVSADLHEVIKRHFKELQSWASTSSASKTSSPIFKAVPNEGLTGSGHLQGNSGYPNKKSLHYR